MLFEWKAGSRAPHGFGSKAPRGPPAPGPGAEANGFVHPIDRGTLLPNLPLDPTRLYATLVAPARKRLYLRVAEEIPIGAYRIVDVECGTGDLAHAIAHYNPDARVNGVDSDSVQLALAKKLHGNQTGLTFKKGRATELPYEDGTVDHVVSSERFNLWSKPEAVLDEIHRVLRPGGSVWIFTGRGDLTPEEMREGLDVPDLPGVYAAVRAAFYVQGYSDRRLDSEVRPAFERSRFQSCTIEPWGAFARLSAQKARA